MLKDQLSLISSQVQLMHVLEQQRSVRGGLTRAGCGQARTQGGMHPTHQT